MIRRGATVLAGVLAIMAAAQPLQAQRGDNPRAELQRKFEASGLREGAEFPDAQIYDAKGNPFQTGEFKGDYTVLVTGCLT